MKNKGVYIHDVNRQTKALSSVAGPSPGPGVPGRQGRSERSTDPPYRGSDRKTRADEDQRAEQLRRGPERDRR
ncbi:hypothetical protein D3C72_2217360 [compost metagenome]